MLMSWLDVYVSNAIKWWKKFILQQSCHFFYTNCTLLLCSLDGCCRNKLWGSYKYLWHRWRERFTRGSSWEDTKDQNLKKQQYWWFRRESLLFCLSSGSCSWLFFLSCIWLATRPLYTRVCHKPSTPTEVRMLHTLSGFSNPIVIDKL